MCNVLEAKWFTDTEWYIEDEYECITIDQEFFDGVTHEDTEAMKEYEPDQIWEVRIRNIETDNILFYKEVRGGS